MKIIRASLLALLASMACADAGAQAFEWESKDSLLLDPGVPLPRAQLDDARRRLDELRENATADDYRTVRTQGKRGRAAFRRVPTDEFASRIERAEDDRDQAEAELRLLERGLR
jgi:hypothetical protein